MKWLDFKNGVRECPDELLHERFCIWDNFPIIWSGLPVQELVSSLISSGNYHNHSLDNDVISDMNGFKEEFNKMNLKQRERLNLHHNNCLAYSLGTVVIVPYLEGREFFTFSYDNNPKYKRLEDFQKARYSNSIILHPGQKKKEAGVNWIRTMAKVIEEIAERVFIPGNVPFCFPKVFYYNLGGKSQDYSTIVYWPDSDEEEMCR